MPVVGFDARPSVKAKGGAREQGESEKTANAPRMRSEAWSMGLWRGNQESKRDGPDAAGVDGRLDERPLLVVAADHNRVEQRLLRGGDRLPIDTARGRDNVGVSAGSRERSFSPRRRGKAGGAPLVQPDMGGAPRLPQAARRRALLWRGGLADRARTRPRPPACCSARRAGSRSSRGTWRH